MNVKQLLFGLGVVLITQIMPAPTLGYVEPFIVNFPDKEFEAFIRQHIDKPDGTIYNTDLIGLTSLTCYGNYLESIEGIQYCVDLEMLHFCGRRNIKYEFSPLVGMENLTAVSVHFTSISDIRIFAQMPQLTILHLFGNKISDLSPLSELDNLEALSLSGNEICKIEPLGELIGLETLNLTRNHIADITPLAGLESLFKLELNNNQISDLSPLLELPSLRWLEVKDNPLSDESINVIIPELEARGVHVMY